MRTKERATLNVTLWVIMPIHSLLIVSCRTSNRIFPYCCHQAEELRKEQNKYVLTLPKRKYERICCIGLSYLLIVAYPYTLLRVCVNFRGIDNADEKNQNRLTSILAAANKTDTYSNDSSLLGSNEIIYAICTQQVNSLFVLGAFVRSLSRFQSILEIKLNIDKRICLAGCREEMRVLIKIFFDFGCAVAVCVNCA